MNSEIVDSKNLKYSFHSIVIIIFIIAQGVSSFTFGQPTNINIVSPQNGQTIFPGSEIIISWTSFNVHSINIDYKADDGPWQLIKKDISHSSKNFIWEIPESVGTNLSIRISSFEHREYSSKVTLNIEPSKNETKLEINNNLNASKNNNSVIKIMPLGDSITEGIVGSANEVGYRRTLDSLLTSINFKFDLVGTQSTGLVFDFDRDNEGHGGWHAKHKNLSRRSMVDSLYKWLEISNPDVVLLHIGTNDIGELDIFNETVMDVVSDIEELLNIIDTFETNYNKTVYVFLAQIIRQMDDPSNSFNEEDSTIVFNDSLANLANTRINAGDNLILVDHEDKINYPSDLYDGIHPNDSGYKKIGTAWFNALKTEFDFYPIILNQPITEGVIEGNDAEFLISVTGLEPIEIQWYKNGAPIIGATDSIYTFSNPTFEDNNSEIYCLVSNSLDTVSSDTVKLFVTPFDKRVDGGLIAYYDFEELSGNIINDTISQPEASNLEINTPASVKWLDHGLEILTEPTISTINKPSKLYNKCTKSNEITIEAWLKPSTLTAVGPARIISYSKDSKNRNITIGQDLNVFVVRLRTSETDTNGFPEIYSSNEILDTVLTHFIFTRNSNGVARIYINGEQNLEVNHPGNFSNWDSNFNLGIGNEFVDSRPWTGIFYQLSIFDRALDSVEAFHNYKFGEPGITDVLPPTDLQILNSSIGLISLSWNDNSQNEKGFIVERSEIDSLNFVTIDSTQLNESSYDDLNIVEGMHYFYKIHGYNNFNISEQSNIASVISSSNVVFSPTDLVASTDTTGNVYLNWNDNSNNEFGFIIERRPDLQDSVFYTIDTTSLTTYIDTIPKFYSTFEYRVKAFNFAVESGYSNIYKQTGITDVNIKSTKPNGFILHQNYPNPFNPSTNISFEIPDRSNIKIELYNSIGEKITDLVHPQILNSGVFSIKFDATNLPSGVYFYKLTSTSLLDNKHFISIKKMLLLK